ncbi:uncharacterized protein LOC112203979 [Rosa chinensis]|uniref:uncharacterized protein LOC112203979 n=1 Tax=Rosa chinensis TaxID=74649 RepID=UPI001AD93C40|nr:uncharacterized protein LOC112203979 [Rosa chinensis]
MDVKLMFSCMFDFKLNSVDILVRDSNGSTILVPYCGGSSSFTSATTSLDDFSCASSCLSVGSSNIIDAKCAKRYSDGCQWSICALKNKVNGFFYIKKLNNVHTCKGILRQQKSKLLGSNVVKSEIANELKSNPQLKPKEIVSRFKHSFGLDVPYRLLGMGRSWLEKLSMVMMVTHILSCFGFKSCILLLFVDAAQLKKFFPFAFAVVDSENHANWDWFFDHLYNILSPQGRNVTFVTDRHSRLLNAVSRIVEEFMKVAYSPTLASYNFNLHNLKKEGGLPIEEFLRSLPLEKWCNAFFKGNRYGEMANSVAESFNNWTRDLRELPIFEMFEGLRFKVMENMSERKVACRRWTTILCPPMEALLKKSMDIGRHWAVSMSSETVFEVHSDKSVAVDLGNNTCSCCQWQINSFPCSHALAAIQKVGVEPVYSYIEPFYTCQSYMDSYAHGIHPIPNIKFYEDAASSTSVVKPPLVRRPSGRPKSVRMKSTAEGGMRRRIKCGRCGELGRHNKITCTAPI